MKFSRDRFMAFLALLLFAGCFEVPGGEKGYYQDGKYYYPDGTMGLGLWKDSLRQGEWTFYSETRLRLSTGSFKDDIAFGAWKFWYANGQIESEGDYENDQKQGVWTFYYADGRKKSAGDYRNGERIGGWGFWYENGQAKERRLYHKGLNYLVESWFKDGRPMVVEGNGAYEYRENGLLLELGAYQDSLATGRWEFYDVEGKLTGTASYEAGVKQ